MKAAQHTPLAKLAEKALIRAAESARKLSEQTKTPWVVSRDEQVTTALATKVPAKKVRSK